MGPFNKDHYLFSFDEFYLMKTLLINPSLEGIRTSYYLNFNTDVQEEENTNSEEMTEEEKQFFEQLKQLEAESGCASGGCSL